MEMMSSDISKLAEALSKAQGSISAIKKNKKAKIRMKSGDSYEYTYADLADIWESIRGPLSQNGLAISQPYTEMANSIQLVTILMHSSGQWIKSILTFPTNNLKIQEIGSAMTYNRRYALSGILGISTEDDDDGNLANEMPREKKQEQNHPPVIENIPQNHIDTISTEDAQHIENLIPFYPIMNNKMDPRDDLYRKDLLGYFSNVHKSKFNDFFNFPKKYYDAVLRSINRRKENLRTQEEKNEEQLPF